LSLFSNFRGEISEIAASRRKHIQICRADGEFLSEIYADLTKNRSVDKFVRRG